MKQDFKTFQRVRETVKPDSNHRVIPIRELERRLSKPDSFPVDYAHLVYKSLFVSVFFSP